MTDGKRKGIYLLPNLLTTSGLFSGFYAIIAAMKGSFELSAQAIFVAMIFDMFDGRVARMTNTQSSFGAEYDSLSDMVAFGLAPAIILYSWSLHSLGKIGWLISFFYTAMTALRLARFNVRIGQDNKNFFCGLPCPAAAGTIASFIAMSEQFDFAMEYYQILIAAITVLLGIFMVSHLFKYYSFKEIDRTKHVPFIWMLALISIFIFVSLEPATILFSIFFSYAFSGPIYHLWRSLKAKRRKI